MTSVSGRNVEMWVQEDRKIFSDSFHKGLWDFEATYLDRYFTREWMVAKHTMDQLVQQARMLDRNHPPSVRSHNGNFHSWTRWIHHCEAEYKRCWAVHEEGRARSSRFPRNRRPAKYGSMPGQTYHVSEEAVAEPTYNTNVEQPVVNRIVKGQCTICLQPTDREHQNCVVRCLRCHQEGHRMVECPSKPAGGGDNNPQN